MKPTHGQAEQHFADIERNEKSTWPEDQWHGEIDNCDVCSRPMHSERYMVDGPANATVDPPWGNLCAVCALKYSPTIGWGKAQLYRNTGRKWALVAGGPPKITSDEEW